METLGTIDIVSGLVPVFLCVSDEELTVTFSLEHFHNINCREDHTDSDSASSADI